MSARKGGSVFLLIVISKKGADIKFKIIPFELLDRQCIFLFGGNTRSKWITTALPATRNNIGEIEI